MSAGKGDKARNNSSPQFFRHYDEIDWGGPEFQRCEKCGAKIRDWQNPERKLKNTVGRTIYICSKEKH